MLHYVPSPTPASARVMFRPADRVAVGSLFAAGTLQRLALVTVHLFALWSGVWWAIG